MAQSDSRQSDSLAKPLILLANRAADPLIANQPAPPPGGHAAGGVPAGGWPRFCAAARLTVPLPACFTPLAGKIAYTPRHRRDGGGA